MKLHEYEAIIDGIESGETRASAEWFEWALLAVAGDCRRALWQPPYRARARTVADRAEALLPPIIDAACEVHCTRRQFDAATYCDHVARIERRVLS
ncbi:MAG TPA: hypothetical protein VNH11_27545 [Pirellulales bacterium]|nr:hypothetical protein [Pirellulales bacterium]